MFGSGEERLIMPDEFAREVAQFGLRSWESDRGRLHVFRFALAL